MRFVEERARRPRGREIVRATLEARPRVRRFPENPIPDRPDAFPGRRTLSLHDTRAIYNAYLRARIVALTSFPTNTRKWRSLRRCAAWQRGFVLSLIRIGAAIVIACRSDASGYVSVPRFVRDSLYPWADYESERDGSQASLTSRAMFKPACTHAVRAYAGSETDAVRAPGRRVFLPDDAQCTIVSSSFASGRLAQRDAAFIPRRGYVAGLGLLPSAGRRACV